MINWVSKRGSRDHNVKLENWRGGKSNCSMNAYIKESSDFFVYASNVL